MVNMKQDKNRLNGLQLVRFLCAIGIVIFHFECHLENTFLRFIQLNLHVTLGGICVYSFFILSGIVLYYNYRDNFSLKTYFYKRWKSIFILFYLLYFILYIKNWFVTGKFFWGPQKWKIIFSFIGCDGYLMNHGVSTWYLIGEWFLGVLLILYIIFPLFMYVTKRFKYSFVLLLIILFALYSLAIDTDILSNLGIKTDKGTDIFTSMFYFYLGIVFVKYKRYIIENKFLPLILIPFTVYFMFINVVVPISITLIFVVVGLFLLFNLIGNILCKNSILQKIINNLSGLTYAMFLLQHVIVLAVINSFNPQTIAGYFFYMLLSIMLTLFFAKLSCIVENYIARGCLFCYLDRKFLT